MDEPKQPKQPIGIVAKPDSKISISTSDFFVLKQFFEVFQGPIALIEKIENQSFANGTLKLYTEDDIIKKDDGTTNLRLDFWDLGNNPEQTDDIHTMD